MPGELAYTNAELAHPTTPRDSRSCCARRDRTSSASTTPSSEEDLAAQLAVLTPFLDTYFPVPSPWEKPGSGGPAEAGAEA